MEENTTKSKQKPYDHIIPATFRNLILKYETLLNVGQTPYRGVNLRKKNHAYTGNNKKVLIQTNNALSQTFPLN